MVQVLRIRNKRLALDAAPTFVQSAVGLLYAMVNGIIGVYLLFQVRDAISVYVAVSGVSVWARWYIEVLSGIFLSVIWIALLVFAQHVYERDFMHRWLPIRFIYFTCIQLAGLVATVWYIQNVPL